MADNGPTVGKATQVCLPCKTAKRQCDKQLPSCSRCKKLNRGCEYEPLRKFKAPPQVEVMAGVVSSQSCTRCRSNKRKCNRSFPACSRCLRLRVNCGYEDPKPVPVASPGDLPLIDPNIQHSDHDLGVAWGVPIPFKPPIDMQPYMPRLINFFLTSVALSSNSTFPSSLADHLRSEWMQHAMLDPCLFHATMFSASASIDMLYNRSDSFLTTYHQTWTIKLVNERLNQPEPVINYGTVGSVIPLLYYNIVGLDKHSAFAHQKGLVKMLLSLPKAQRTELAPLIAIIKIAMLSFACVFNRPPVWDCLKSESIRPNAILRNLLASPQFNRQGSLFETETIDSILDIYELVSQLDHLVEADTTTITLEVQRIVKQRESSRSPATFPDLSSVLSQGLYADTASKVNASCRLCSYLLWRIVESRAGTVSLQQESLRCNIEEGIGSLLAYLTSIDSSFWIQNAAEALAFLVFTGAAVTADEKKRRALINHGSTILTAVEGEKISLLRQGWRYFTLLKRVAGTGQDETSSPTGS